MTNIEHKVQVALTVLHGRDYQTVREAFETTDKGKPSEKKTTVYSLMKPTVETTVDIALTEAFGQQTALMQWRHFGNPVAELEETPGDFLERITGSGPDPRAF